MSVSLYRARAKGRKRLARVHVKVGKTKVIRQKLRAKRTYLFAVRHAGNGHRHARRAINLQYYFDVNFPGDFRDANGCA